MKLRTSLTVSHDGTLVDATDANLIADAACAHALMRAIHNRIQAAEDNCDNKTMLAMKGALNYASELMREWGFDSGEDAE